MEALFDAGKAKAIGVSNFSTKKPGGVSPFLATNCAQGFLQIQRRSPLWTTWLTSDVLKNPILGMVAETLGKTPAQVALRWGLQMGQSVLPKSTHEDRIRQNFDVFSWSIPDDMLSKFSEIEQASRLHSK
uniref:NADP-dependent oxidoreductase domain-containing protein n=1 Tax=Brassica oleracea var. oleracea TaxID=109376 RepID=A0A0D3BR36_BRAOL